MAALISRLDVFLVYLLLLYQTGFCLFLLLVNVVELISLRVGFGAASRETEAVVVYGIAVSLGCGLGANSSLVYGITVYLGSGLGANSGGR